jgi:hypothetical protein
MILIKSTLTMFICLYVRFYLFLKLQFLLRFLDCLKKLYFVCLQFNKHNISNYYIISYEKKLEVKKHFARTTLTARAKKFSSLILLFHFEVKTRLFRFCKLILNRFWCHGDSEVIEYLYQNNTIKQSAIKLK